MEQIRNSNEDILEIVIATLGTILFAWFMIVLMGK